MRMYRSVVLSIAAALWFMSIPVDAKVGEFTGDDYLRHCVGPDPNWKPKNRDEQDMAVYCAGYVEGAITLIVVMDGRGYCLPKGTTPQDVMKATFSFLRNHPDQKQYLLGGAMFAAAMLNWPCRSR